MRRFMRVAKLMLLIAALMLFMPSAKCEDAYALKCHSADGTRQFPAVRPAYALRTPEDKNAFHALLRALGITFDQYQAWGVKCDKVMGLDDPRPYSSEISDQEFRKKHAACLPPDDVAALPHGALLYKIYNGCPDVLDIKDLSFVAGMANIGIDECGFLNDRISRLTNLRLLAYVMGFTMSKDIAEGLAQQAQIAQGTVFGRMLQCSPLLERYTAGTISYVRTH